MMKKILAGIILCSNITQAQNDSSSKIHIGFVYPLSTNGQWAQHYSNDASFHVLGGVSDNEHAFCFSGISNLIVHKANGFVFAGVVNHIGDEARGMQFAGASNIILGEAEGMQFAGFNNISKSFRGCQVAGFSNISKGAVSGMQIAGFSNFSTDTVHGCQVAGFSNISDEAQCQISGFSNISRNADGLQVAGFSNVSQNARGLQVAGFSNIAKDINGVQVAGFINVARKVRGAQIAGFINIADSCEYPIGIINIIRNGDKSIGASIDETGTGMLSFRSGSKRLYGILGVGYNLVEPKLQYGMEAGIGARFPFNLLFRFNVEATVLTLSDFRNGAFMKSSFRFFPSMRIARNLEVFGGPTFSFTNTPAHLAEKFDIPYVWSRYSNGTFYGMNVGAIGGIQVHF
ncbi:MAG: hypothetical protein V4561_13480 [Bacteroidota bacterium]